LFGLLGLLGLLAFSSGLLAFSSFGLLAFLPIGPVRLLGLKHLSLAW